MNKNEIIESEPLAILPRERDDLALTPVFDLETAQNRLIELQKFVKFYLVEGEDFGTIPGTAKPTLYKPGADKLCDIYGIADRYRITNRTEDWDRNLFDYEIECTLESKRTQHLVATGVGSCNSYEGKYRWRETQRKCPECGKATIIRGKKEFGGGWLCWKKKDGCGHKFADGDKAIEGQNVDRVENDDIPTLKNTILKMAKKRAKIDAVLSATRSSGLFTQDIEDWVQVEQHEEGSAEAAKAVGERKTAELKERVQKDANAKNTPSSATPKQEGIVFIVSWPDTLEGDVEVTGSPKTLLDLGVIRLPENRAEGHEDHRLIKRDLMVKFHDLCRKKNVLVKDLTSEHVDA